MLKMRAMVLPQLVSLAEATEPLVSVELVRPRPQPGEVLVKVRACGVCHTELDEIEGRTPPAFFPIALGHEVVGIVEEVTEGVEQLGCGQRVGIGWIHHSCGGPQENLSSDFRATGRDVHGGYAQYMTVPANYAYPIPERFTDAQAAPLLCAGAIGYRALRLTGLKDGQPLGLTGFGGSAHLVLQLSRYLYPNSPVYVFARDASARTFARELGAVWAGATEERAPEALTAIIDTTPAWLPVVQALHNLTPGGRLVINAIRKEEADKQELLKLSYHEQLWMEREIKSVANITSQDIREFLPLAAEIPIEPTVTEYRLEQANQALLDLKRGAVRGAKVLVVE